MKKRKEKMIVLKEEPQEQSRVFKKSQDPYQKVLYFAYGSNMSQDQLVHRVGPVKKVDVFRLPNYELSFDCGYQVSYANVNPKEGAFVEGVIYEMYYRQLKILDSYEGLYIREKIELDFIPLKGRKLHFYISRHRKMNFQFPILASYYKTLLRGAFENDLTFTINLLRNIDQHNIVHHIPRAEFDFWNIRND